MRGNSADRNKISSGACKALDMLCEIVGQFIECAGAHTLKNKLHIRVRNEESRRYPPRHELPRQALIIVDGRPRPQATDQSDSLARFFCHHILLIIQLGHSFERNGALALIAKAMMFTIASPPTPAAP